MQPRYARLASVVLIIFLAVSACQAPGLLPRPAATPVPGMVNTLAAKTMQVMFSPTPPVKKPAARPATFTPQPSATVAPSSTPLPTQTPFSTPTSPYSPTPIITGTNPLAGLPCYAAQFIKDITYPDGAYIAPGVPFLKTWRLKNAGSCTWTTQVHVAFVDGERMSPIPVKLTKEVKPKETVDMSVILTSPPKPGDFDSLWMLTDGVTNFGVGQNGEWTFWLAVRVRNVDSGEVFNFARSACVGIWENGSASLPCPGKGTETKGYLLVQEPISELGIPSGILHLITVPPIESGGFIRATFPPITIHKNDHFFADIGCQPNSPGCNVTFRVDYRVDDGAPQLLGQWKVTSDASTRHVDINLIIVSGKIVQFILSVKANGPYVLDNRAFWQDPQIQR